MVTLLAAGSSAPLGHHFGAFAVFLIAVVAGCLVWALRDGAQRGARDADRAAWASRRRYQPRHSAKLAPPRDGAARVSAVDDSPTVVIRLDGSWRA